MSDVFFRAVRFQDLIFRDESNDFVGFPHDGFQIPSFAVVVALLFAVAVVVVGVGVGVETVQHSDVVRNVIRALSRQIYQQAALHAQLRDPLRKREEQKEKSRISEMKKDFAV